MESGLLSQAGGLCGFNDQKKKIKKKLKYVKVHVVKILEDLYSIGQIS